MSGLLSFGFRKQHRQYNCSINGHVDHNIDIVLESDALHVPVQVCGVEKVEEKVLWTNSASGVI